MSASLVGSEMCIRDRSQRRRAQGRTNLQEWLGKPRSDPRTFRSWRKKHSVSYTHLTLPTICSV
eukprot:11146795-Alexandrium_andersonii.AAC.1